MLIGILNVIVNDLIVNYAMHRPYIKNVNRETNGNIVFSFAKHSVQSRTNRCIYEFEFTNPRRYFYHFLRLFRSTHFLAHFFHQISKSFTKLNSNRFSDSWSSAMIKV